jgi:sugar lactone lactonase YvrE
VTPEVELLLDSRATIGESPTWYAPERALFWIDVKEPALHRLGSDGSTRRWQLESDIGAFALLEGAGGALVALRSGIFSLNFRTSATRLLAQAPFDSRLFRFNEGICDAQGRFWVGVMFDPIPASRAETSLKGLLHRFTFAQGLTAASDHSALHNGFAWSCRHDAFFWSHSKAGRIYRAPYDPTAGELGSPELFVDVQGGECVPDGAAMDEEGCYWCAIHGAGVLHRYDATGILVSQIRLPVSQPTMCAFVGANLDEMVVTSARENLSPAQLRREPHAGGVFRFQPGVRGVERPCVVR